MLAPINSPIDTPNFFSYVKFPVFASPKIDGIRGLAQAGALYSRTLKRIPSKQAQSLFGKYRGLDGELTEGWPIGHDLFNRTSSVVRSANVEADLHYHVFDHVRESTINDPFIERFVRVTEFVANANNPRLHLVPHYLCRNLEELLYLEEEVLLMGYEGLMLRNPYGHYKPYARATMLEGLMFKLKRFVDTEGEIIGFREGKINLNEQVRDERGYAHRSSSKEGKINSGMVGTILCKWNDRVVKVAPGSFRKDMLRHMWENQDEFIGAMLKFRFFNFGIVNELRFARALGLRAEFDMSKD